MLCLSVLANCQNLIGKWVVHSAMGASAQIASHVTWYQVHRRLCQTCINKSQKLCARDGLKITLLLIVINDYLRHSNQIHLYKKCMHLFILKLRGITYLKVLGLTWTCSIHKSREEMLRETRNKPIVVY